MVWRRASAYVLGLVVGCGPGASGDASSGSDDEGSTITTGPADGSAGPTGSVDASSTGGECPPNAVSAIPGCADPEPGVVQLPGAGCYEVCEDADSTACSEGACVPAWTNPCGEGGTCGVCGNVQWLCVAGDPLAPGFEQDLVPTSGCGLGTFHVAAGSDDGDVVLRVSVGAGLLEAAQSSGTTQMQNFALPSEDASVWVSLGPDVLSNHCNDAPTGTELRRYDATAGSVDVTIVPPPMGAPDTDQGTATLVLSDVELQQASGGDPITLATFTFDAVAIWCCPG